MRLISCAMAILCLLCCIAAAEAMHSEDERPFLGFSYVPTESIDKDDLEIRLPDGLVVISSRVGFPAHHAGLREGDVIVSAHGQRLNNADDLRQAIDTAMERKRSAVQLVWRRRNDQSGRWRTIGAAVPLRSKLKSLQSLLTVESDQATGITTLRHNASPSSVRRSTTVLEIQRIDGRTRLAMRVSHSARNWLFMRELILSTPAGDRLEISLDSPLSPVHRDHDHQGIWEWKWVSLNSSETNTLRSILNSGFPTVTLFGQSYRREREMKPDERDRLWSVLLAWDLLESGEDFSTFEGVDDGGK